MTTTTNHIDHEMDNTRMKSIKTILGNDWLISSAGGATGEAYFAECGEQQLFLKRNSSPFLAVLSVEGIVPKLLWTKRLENGDVITAQRWVKGRELKAAEMNNQLVAQLLSHIHRSKELVDMLKRLGKKPLLPTMLIKEITEQMPHDLRSNDTLVAALKYLRRHVNCILTDEYVVCHGDVNHNNWIIGEDGSLYLIDWDGAMVADSALDLGLLLYWYVPKAEWETWLKAYGICLTPSLRIRMHWYVIAETMLSIFWHHKRNQLKDQEQWLTYLKDLLQDSNE